MPTSAHLFGSAGLDVMLWSGGQRRSGIRSTKAVRKASVTVNLGLAPGVEVTLLSVFAWNPFQSLILCCFHTARFRGPRTKRIPYADWILHPDISCVKEGLVCREAVCPVLLLHDEASVVERSEDFDAIEGARLNTTDHAVVPMCKEPAMRPA